MFIHIYNIARINVFLTKFLYRFNADVDIKNHKILDFDQNICLIAA